MLVNETKVTFFVYLSGLAEHFLYFLTAIGDSDNDLAMLRAVGCPIAMGNGSAAVKEAACYVTATNEEDGVAKAIRHLLRM